MSFTDTLFGGTDSTVFDAQYNWNKAVADHANNEFPQIQGVTDRTYDLARSSLGGYYNQGRGAIDASVANQIGVLSRVPDMTYNTLANGYNLAGQGMLGAGGSAINAPAMGYQPVTYGGYQPYPVYQQPAPMGGAIFPQQAPALPPAAIPQQAPQQVPQQVPPQQAPLVTPIPQQAPAPQQAPLVTAPQQAPSNPGALGGPSTIPEQLTAALNAPAGQGQLQGDERIRALQAYGPETRQWQAIEAAGYDPVEFLTQPEDMVRTAFDRDNQELTRTLARIQNTNESGAAGMGALAAGDNDLAATLGLSQTELANYFGVSGTNPTDHRAVMRSILGEDPLAAGVQGGTYLTGEEEAERANQAERATRFANMTPDAPRNNVVDPAAISDQERYAQNQQMTAQKLAQAQARFQTPDNSGLTPEELQLAQEAQAEDLRQRSLEQMGGGPSPAQQASYPTRPTAAPYSPATAALNATRSQLAKTPDNEFAQGVLGGLESGAINFNTPQRPGPPPAPSLPPATATNPPTGRQDYPQPVSGPTRVQSGGYSGGATGINSGPQQQISAGLQQAPQQSAGGYSGGVSPTAIDTTGINPVINNQGSPNPWNGPQNYGPPQPGTGMLGANDTLNAALGSANNTLGMSGQSAVNAIGTGVQGGLGAVAGYIGTGANQLAPYQNSGMAANAMQANLNGLNGYEAQQQGINYALASPEFQFMQDQGEQGVLRNQAALGGMGGGNVMKELSRFNQGLASQRFDTYYNRLGGQSQLGAGAAGQAAGLYGQGAGLAGNINFQGGMGAANQIGDTGRQQAANTMGFGQLMAGNQQDYGNNLGSMAWGGANTIAGQFPTLAMAGSDAYGNQGARNAQLYANQGNQYAGLYQGQGQDLNNASYNRWNIFNQQTAYPGLGQTPGQLGQIGDLAAGIGTAAAGVGAFLNPAAAAGTAVTLSDIRLKANIQKQGVSNGHNFYTWEWNDKGKEMAGSQQGFGVIAQEVLEKVPEAIIVDNGYLKVDYSRIH